MSNIKGEKIEQINIDTGLNDKEVEQRIKNNQVNYDDQPKTKSFKEIVKSNFFTYFNYINFGLGMAILIAGLISGQFFESLKNCLFMGVIIINSVIAIVQEFISKTIIDKLSLLTATKANVIRNGVEKQIDNEQIVIDDIILFNPGNQVTVDCLIKKGTVEVNEAFITGESNPITKKVGEKILSGSFIVSGKCTAIVTNVGSDNYISKISSGAKYIKKVNSVILNSFEKILKVISVFIIPTAIIMYITQLHATSYDFAESLFTTVAALIGMIPEGLILLTSSVMAVSVIRMAKYNVLVQELYCIETLARVNVICLDKTGTLTTGKMKLCNVIYKRKSEQDDIDEILNNYCSSSEDNNPTINAIKQNYNNSNNWEVIKSIPFSSDRKFSAISFSEEGNYYLGAPEIILKDKIKKYQNEIEKYQQDYRVLVLAKSNEKVSEKPHNLQILAYLLIEDEIRKEASKTLRYFKNEKVAIKIISGDNIKTISSIAKKLGMQNVNAIDLSEVADEDLSTIVKEYNIFGRVKPEQKLKIIQLLKQAGNTVAMMGDGINDVLALKESDCAITVASGSDSAKCVSQLVLLDSNFDSLPKVVAEGRRSINNIQRSASLMLVKTIYTILLVLFCVSISTKYFFVPIQLSLITTFTMSIPSFILALEPNDNIVEGNFLLKIISKSLPVALTVVFIIMIITFFKLSFGIDEELCSTLSVFLTGTIGFIFLYRLCQPFNRLRRLLFVSLIIGFIYCAFYQYEFFNLKAINFEFIVIFGVLYICSIYVFDKLNKIVSKLLEIYLKYVKNFKFSEIKQKFYSKIGVIQK